MTEIRFLLINAIDKSEKLQAVFPHLGLGYIAQYLRENFDSIEIKIAERDIKETILKFKPDVVGISAVSENFNMVKGISAHCKKEDIHVIVGGSHISALPSSLNPSMDVGVIGEGEQTVLELIEFFEKYRTFKSDKLGKIDGIVYEYDGKKVITNRRNHIDPLDKLPFPARDLLNIREGDVVHLFSSRGCIYRCRFCSLYHFWKNIRFFSVRYILTELKDVIDKYHPPHIVFYDDLFIANRKRLEEIANLIKREKINEQISFSVQCRANLVNNKIIHLLKQMNVTNICMGLESASEKTLRYLKDGVTIQQNKDAIKIIKKYGIWLNATFIIASPYETEEEILETLDFIRRSKLDKFDVYILTPLPGTPIWDYALKEKIVSEDMDWSRLSMICNMRGKIVLSEKIKQRKLLELYSLFQKEKIKIYLRYLIAKGIRNPHLIIPFLRKNTKFVKS